MPLTRDTDEKQPAQLLGAPVEAHSEGLQLTKADDVRNALSDALESIGSLMHETHAFLAQQGARSPTLLLTSAAGLGFVLGGGLASPTGVVLARAGAKIVLAQVVQSLWGATTSASIKSRQHGSGGVQ
jgi:hypothetical protein